MSEEWEQHRHRYEPDRIENYDAYVDAWTRDHEARRKFADWDTFARCCDADMTMIRKAPDLVRDAEALMARIGYRLGTGSGGSSRRWVHTRGAVRTTSERPVRAPGSSASSKGSVRSPRTPRAAAPKKPAAPPKAPPKPTHVECPNDPGMMVPLSGSCICGWSPADG